MILTDDEITRVREIVGSVGFASMSVYRALMESTVQRPVTIDEARDALDRINAALRSRWDAEQRAEYDALPKLGDIVSSPHCAWRWK